MDLDNRSPFPGAFLNTIISEERLLGAVVVKAAFHVRNDGLVPDHDSPWPVGGDPIKTEFGEIEGETPFLREGVDLIVLGKAYPSGPPAGLVTVTVRAGSFSYGLSVFGDRTWVRKSRKGPLVASDPAPFAAMPLLWERAYGGKVPVDAGEMPFAANPVGRGFYLEEAQAENGPLPNLEDPDHPVRTWQDQPEPRGTGPYAKDWSLRALRAAEFDLTGAKPRLVRFKPAYFNNANPHLVLKSVPTPGEVISISNVRPKGGGLRFALPDLAFHVFVQLQDRPYVFPAHLESILVLAEEERVVLSYRCVFRYRMVPLERRIAVLRTGPAPSAPPPDYLVRWDELDQKGQVHE